MFYSIGRRGGALLAGVLLVLLALSPVSAAPSAEAAGTATPGIYEFLGRGFRPHESIRTWLTGPSGQVIATDIAGSDRDGVVFFRFPIPRHYEPGQWAMTAAGWDSGRRAIATFMVAARGPDITLQASQAAGPPGTTFVLTGGPLAPGDVGSYWTTAPNGQDYPGGFVTADETGRVDFTITIPADALPGPWAITLYGPVGDHLGQTTVTIG
jgi:hypothetical protein